MDPITLIMTKGVFIFTVYATLAVLVGTITFLATMFVRELRANKLW